MWGVGSSMYNGDTLYNQCTEREAGKVCNMNVNQKSLVIRPKVKSDTMVTTTDVVTYEATSKTLGTLVCIWNLQLLHKNSFMTAESLQMTIFFHLFCIIVKPVRPELLMPRPIMLGRASQVLILASYLSLN